MPFKIKLCAVFLSCLKVKPSCLSHINVHREIPGLLISPQPDQVGNKLGSMSGTRAISTKSRRELSSSIFSLQGKALKEIHAIRQKH